MMIAGRNAMLTRGAAPSDADVEWLYMPYGSYVDTGVTGLDLTNFEIDLTVKADGYPETASAFCGVYGLTSGIRSYGAIIRQYPQGTLQGLVVYVPQGSNTETNLSRTTTLPSDYAQISLSSSAFSVDGAVIGSGYTVPGNIRDLNNADLWLCINGRKDKTTSTGNVVSTKAAGWYRAFAVYNAGILVRDFIPRRVGSGPAALGYLYDKANPTGGPLGNGLYGNAADGQGGVTGFPAACIGPDKP